MGEAAPWPANPPVRGLCAEDAKSDCASGTRAWCDTTGRVIACCAPDLVAAGADGVCDCPPGGAEPNVKSSCATRPGSDDISQAGAVVRALRPELVACYDGALEENRSLVGAVVLVAQIGPDGRVFSARIKEGRMPSADVQRCLLDVMRAARFPPPRGGMRTLHVPVAFASKPPGARPPEEPTPPE
jgi:TonB family protein